MCGLRSIAAISILLLLASLCASQRSEVDDADEKGEAKYAVVGKVTGPEDFSLPKTKLLFHGDNGIREAFVASDGSFSLPQLQSGSYILEVVSSQYHFPTVRSIIARCNAPGFLAMTNAVTQLRVFINSKGNVKATIFGETTPVGYPLILHAMERVQYFEERKPFDIVEFVMKNPMLLMIGSSVVLMLLMTKCIDPEELQRFQQGGFSALLNPEEQQQGEAASGQAAASPQEQHDRGTRRRRVQK